MQVRTADEPPSPLLQLASPPQVGSPRPAMLTDLEHQRVCGGQHADLAGDAAGLAHYPAGYGPLGGASTPPQKTEALHLR